jgi:hypothetical protein
MIPRRQQRHRRVGHLVSGFGEDVTIAVVVLLLLLDVVRIVDDTIIHRMRHGLLFAVRIIIIDGILLLFDVSIIVDTVVKVEELHIARQEAGDIQNNPRQLSWKTPPSPGEDSDPDGVTEGELLQD